MTITAKIITDSVSPDGIRLITMQLRYPKFIHGEFMTHRVFSRNASSSRAIPVERMIQDVLDDPAMPVHWGANRPGMQAREECDNSVTLWGEPHDSPDLFTAPEAWLTARDHCVHIARAMHASGYHKQIVNRLIEPWCHINVVVTATEWDNFYALRRHPDAQPEMKALADVMWAARLGSFTSLITEGEWHLPYISWGDWEQFNHLANDECNGVLRRLSVARCARVSYLTHEGKPPDIEADLELYDRLVGAVPIHASPTEHQATPDTRYSDPEDIDYHRWMDYKNSVQHGNLVGWCQYRKMLPGESGLQTR